MMYSLDLFCGIAVERKIDRGAACADVGTCARGVEEGAGGGAVGSRLTKRYTPVSLRKIEFAFVYR